MNLREAAYPSHYPPIHSPGIRLYRTSVRQPTPPSTYHSTAGWVDFALFSNFIKKSQGLGASLSTIWGTTKFFLIFVQKPVRATPFKVFSKKSRGQKIKNKKILLGKILSCLYYTKKNQILNKNLFDTFFDFFKRVIFQQKSFA